MLNEKQRLNEIFSQYNPMDQIDRGLFQKNKEKEFENFVLEKTKDLDPMIQQRIIEEIFYWGPLSPLLEKDDLFDIIIQGPEAIYYETSKGMEKLNDCFLSEISFQNFVDRLSHESSIIVDKKTPFANGKFKSFRVHIAIPPVVKETTITLRKHNTRIFSLDQLEQSGFLTSPQKQWFSSVLDERRNFLVIGPTGSGKTTFINSLLQSIPETERIVITEDTDELNPPSSLTAKMISREICPDSLDPVTMGDLVKQSLRMRPDRVVVGEVRGEEAKDLLQALATGHSGSMGTLHAHSAAQALIRLEMLIQMGAPQWSLYSIRQLIRMSLDYLIVLKENRLSKGIKEVVQIGALEDFGLLLEEVDFSHPMIIP